ncbi:MAG: ADP-ribosylglycohydrolase family protein [Clostridium sp.]|nr:ADP-ribosylglycohydrolase family protein [Prevotella sp.]MCM1428303.1 ADP-ribosylglycohydrolase family protein [Clostridium sp.]MCM1474775.1 ADP-ribosylglycohydrolase family protein [Muribaculaceae bacterium]
MNLILTEKIRGCLIGYAVGDTLGKGTEFMTKQEAAIRYPGGLRHYRHIIRDAHRSQWDRTDFTMDTEIVLRLATSILSLNEYSLLEFAQVLYDWYQSNPLEFEARFRQIFIQPNFRTDPVGSAHQVALNNPNHEAYNEALGRAMLLGTLKRDDYIALAKENCMITHYDTRCVSTAAVIARVAHALTWEDREPTMEELCEIAASVDERVVPFIQTAYNGEIEDFDLDDYETYWWTRKAMGSALWTLHNMDNMEEALYLLTDEAGDSDTNAALAMGLMGLKYGSGHLPTELVEGLLQYDRVDSTARRWGKYLEGN